MIDTTHNEASPQTNYFLVIPFFNKKLHKNSLLCWFEKHYVIFSQRRRIFTFLLIIIFPLEDLKEDSLLEINSDNLKSIT